MALFFSFSFLLFFPSQIFALETNYLEETSQVGNVVTGFEDYATGGRRFNQVRSRPADDDPNRIFSLSSVTAHKATPLIDKGTPMTK